MCRLFMLSFHLQRQKKVLLPQTDPCSRGKWHVTRYALKIPKARLALWKQKTQQGDSTAKTEVRYGVCVCFAMFISNNGLASSSARFPVCVQQHSLCNIPANWLAMHSALEPTGVTKVCFLVLPTKMRQQYCWPKSYSRRHCW